jgi:hypothetical protein
MLNTQLEYREALVHTNKAGFDYATIQIEELSYNTYRQFDLNEDGVTTQAIKKSWGFYDILSTATFFKGDTVRKTGIVANIIRDRTTPVLYLTNYDQPLKLSGKTKIEGRSVIPYSTFETAYINGQEPNMVSVMGLKSNSDDRLPRLQKDIFIDFEQYKSYLIPEFDSNRIVNGFEQETKVIDVSDRLVLSEITLKGNLIIRTTDSLRIEASALLEDVLVIAPSVFIAPGFEGTMQIVADKRVTLDKDALLKYPSTITINNDVDSVMVHLKSGSKLAGAIIINGKTYEGAQKRQLIIEEKAKVFGSIYNYGSTQLQGEIIGSLFTDRFHLKTRDSEYENIIHNGSITKESLPKSFMLMPLISNSEGNHYEIIKEF